MVPSKSLSSSHVYDLIVVGAGISGTECALVCARAGLDVLLITTSLDTSYNVVADRLKLSAKAPGLMAAMYQQLSDDCGFVTRWALHRAAKYAIEHQPGIHFLQSNVSSLLVSGTLVTGVNTWEGVARYGNTIVLCVGSFLKARLHSGSLSESAGRLSEMSYDDLFYDLVNWGFCFEDLSLKAEFADGSPPYTVSCKVFAQAEIASDTFALKRLERLYAAGLCISGSLSYEDAAQQGLQLAEQLLKQHSMQ